MKLLFLISVCAGAVLAQSWTVSMISLGVKDMAGSVKFYTGTLGMAVEGQPGEVTLIRAGGVLIALNAPLGRSATAGGSPMAGAVEVIFKAGSVEATHQDLRGRGVHFIADPHEVFPGTWAATFTDPDGHKLTILGPK